MMKMLMEYRQLGLQLRELYPKLDTEKGAVKRLIGVLEKISRLDNVELANRAICLKEGFEVSKKTYMDIDSGNNSFLVSDYDFKVVKDAVGKFINFYYGGVEVIK